jgi:hypothetical protein
MDELLLCETSLKIQFCAFRTRVLLSRWAGVGIASRPRPPASRGKTPAALLFVMGQDTSALSRIVRRGAGDIQATGVGALRIDSAKHLQVQPRQTKFPNLGKPAAAIDPPTGIHYCGAGIGSNGEAMPSPS